LKIPVPLGLTTLWRGGGDKCWQGRPPEAAYPGIFKQALDRENDINAIRQYTEMVFKQRHLLSMLLGLQT
jgi:hypothetical protein